MSSNLDISLNQDGESTVVILSGQIDEDSLFEEIINANPQKLIFDFNGITQINSCGIREWIEFQNKLSKDIQITYKNCPQVIIEQINMVKGFIHENGNVESFYAPYYNEDADKEVKILLTPDQVIGGKAPEIKDEEGILLEFDEIELQYFSFLKNIGS